MFDGTVHDPQDPVGATVFAMLSSTFAEFSDSSAHDGGQRPPQGRRAMDHVAAYPETPPVRQIRSTERFEMGVGRKLAIFYGEDVP
jgi:hypothetical protein